MAGDSEPKDQFAVFRSVVAQLGALTADEQRMVVKWTCEKLGIDVGLAAPNFSAPGQLASPSRPHSGGPDIKTFCTEKAPQSDNHFAAVVAYYYRFVSPQKKEAISGDELQEAARLVNRTRLKDPAKTLHNALSGGLLDKAGRGTFRINTVGENLVAVVLPGGGAGAQASSRKPARRKKPASSGRRKASRK
jgi:hypothetical protein